MQSPDPEGCDEKRLKNDCTPSPTEVSWRDLPLMSVSAFRPWSPSVLTAIKEGKILPSPSVVRDELVFLNSIPYRNNSSPWTVVRDELVFLNSIPYRNNSSPWTVVRDELVFLNSIPYRNNSSPWTVVRDELVFLNSIPYRNNSSPWTVVRDELVFLK